MCIKTAKKMSKAITIIYCLSTRNSGEASNYVVSEERKTYQHSNIRDVVAIMVAANITWMIADAENAFDQMDV